MQDLTIIYLTANRMPAHWQQYQIDTLLKAAGDCPIIAVSRQPMDFATNIVEAGPRGHWNIYRCVYEGASAASTKYVAVAEDDTLYSRQHFRDFRPPDDAVSYNESRWSLFAWDPMYCMRNRISNCALIAPRRYLLEALSERFAAWPDGAPDHITGEVGRERIEKQLGVTVRRDVRWRSKVPIIQLNHRDGIEPRQQNQWKEHGEIKAWDIPEWGRADRIAQFYNEGLTADGRYPTIS